ncbi:MAG: Signal recognition particle receptor FtsY [Methanonatronarchaeales archaeon]|nr:Signal recognition particle receptor FtsY [Methanonatronarchaeales archaeon]
MFEGLRGKVKSFRETVSTTSAARRLKERTLDDALDRLVLDLVESDVAYDVAEEIADELGRKLEGEVGLVEGPGAAVDGAMQQALRDVLDVDGLDVDRTVRGGEGPVHVLFVGPNGAGKTTTVAKLARRYDDLDVVLAAGDTFRAGASEQLGEHAEALGVKMVQHERGADPAAVIYDAMEHARASGRDLVLSDTAGRLHTRVGLMDQLEKIKRVTEPDLVIFVDEAVAGNDAAERSREFREEVGIDGSVLTKVDADSKGGAVLSVVHATGRPIAFVGTGQGYEDLKPFEVEWYLEEVLGAGP